MSLWKWRVDLSWVVMALYSEYKRQQIVSLCNWQDGYKAPKIAKLLAEETFPETRQGFRSSCEACPKFMWSWPKVCAKLAQSLCEVGPKFVQSWPEVGVQSAQSSCEVGPKFAQSFVVKLTSKWKHIFCTYHMRNFHATQLLGEPLLGQFTLKFPWINHSRECAETSRCQILINKYLIITIFMEFTAQKGKGDGGKRTSDRTRTRDLSSQSFSHPSHGDR